MDYIYGKLNQKAQLTEYRGLSTESSTVVVDNTNKTIRVDFTGSTIGSLSGGKINTISVNGNKLNIDDKKNVDITVPYAISQLTNDLNYVTADNKLNADLIDDTQSSNKFITAEQSSKLADIQDGAEKNVQSDWLAVDTAAAILNKPTKLSDFENDLDNYYTKDQTYSKAEIEALIQASIKANMEATVNETM